MAPGIFGLEDPADFRQAVLDALEGGTLIPTTERMNLISEAAARPSDIIRLLFLSGGQKPPARRLGQFNFASVLEQGSQARDDLASQIAATPSTTLQQLIDQFMNTPAPDAVPQAYRGAVIPMRQVNGVYQAASGAQVVEGPTLFTVGEKGTEFALLAPGSIIAPKLSKSEPETQDQAAKAVMEMLVFGERQKPQAARKGVYVKPKKAAHGVKVGDDKRGEVAAVLGTGREALLPFLRLIMKARSAAPRTAEHGAEIIGSTPTPIPVNELPGFTLDSILQGASALGASLSGTSNVSDQIGNQQLQILPFLSVEQRAQIFGDVQAGDDQNLKDVFNLTVPPISAEMQQAQGRAIQNAFSKLSAGTLSSADAELAGQQGFFGLRDLILQYAAGQIDRQAMLGELSRLFNDQQQQLNAAVQTGATGQQLPFAKLNAQPPEVQAANTAILESLFGAPFIQNLLSLHRQLRSNAFGATASASGAPFQLTT